MTAEVKVANVMIRNYNWLSPWVKEVEAFGATHKEIVLHVSPYAIESKDEDYASHCF